MTKEEFSQIYSRLKMDIAGIPAEESDLEEFWQMIKITQDREGPISVEFYENSMRPLLEEAYKNKH